MTDEPVVRKKVAKIDNRNGLVMGFAPTFLLTADSWQLLSNHFVRPNQHVRRDRQSDLLRSLEIDDEFKLGRLLDREIRGLCAFENFVYIGGGAAVEFGQVHAVVHETPGFHMFSPTIYHWEPVPYRQL